MPSSVCSLVSAKIGDKPATDGLQTLRANGAWSDLEQAEFALGYGNAVHQFKNYVICGAEKHGASASERFAEAKEALSKLGTTDSAAVAGIQGVIDAYVAALPTVKAMVADGKTAEEIDKAVKISDQPALEGLAILRGK